MSPSSLFTICFRAFLTASVIFTYSILHIQGVSP